MSLFDAPALMPVPAQQTFSFEQVIGMLSDKPDRLHSGQLTLQSALRRVIQSRQSQGVLQELPPEEISNRARNGVASAASGRSLHATEHPHIDDAAPHNRRPKKTIG